MHLRPHNRHICLSFADRPGRKSPMLSSVTPRPIRTPTSGPRQTTYLFKGHHYMSRYTFVLAALVSLAGLSSGGCRSCSSCHDYDPPVANCNGCSCAPPCGCNGCGCSGGGCSTCSSCGSGPCGCNQPSTAYASPAPASPSKASPAYATKAPSYQQQQTPNQSAMTIESQP